MVSKQVEYTVWNVKTTPALFRANTSLTKILYMVVPTSLLFITVTGSQSVITAPAGHYQPFKKKTCDALCTNRNSETEVFYESCFMVDFQQNWKIMWDSNSTFEVHSFLEKKVEFKTKRPPDLSCLEFTVLTVKSLASGRWSSVKFEHGSTLLFRLHS